MRMDVEDVLKKAVEAHRQGRFLEADQYYTAILNTIPKHPDANHNMGLLAGNVGRVLEAQKHFKVALEQNPKVMQYWKSYINLLIELDELEEAEKAHNEARKLGIQVELQPSSELASNSFPKASARSSARLENDQNILRVHGLANAIKLASQYVKNKKFNEALLIYTDIIEKFPKNKTALNGKKYCVKKVQDQSSSKNKKLRPLLVYIKRQIIEGKSNEVVAKASEVTSANPFSSELFNLIAVAHAKEKIFDQAIVYYKKSLRLNPNRSSTYNNLGSAYNAIGDLEKAISQYKTAIALDPKFAIAYINLGKAYEKLRRLTEAKDCLEKAISLDADNFDAYNSLGAIYLEEGNGGIAAEHFKKVIAIKPDFVEAYNNLSLAFVECKQTDDAKKILDSAIKIKPDFGHLHLGLAQLTKYDRSNEHLRLMLELCETNRLSKGDRCQVHFAIGKAFEDLGDFQGSYDHYSKGNELRAIHERFNAIRFLRLVERMKDISEFFLHKEKARQSTTSNITPIFILGMPRSGTTLVEQIITSHSKVTGAGELRYIQELSRDLLNLNKNLTVNDFKFMQKSYFERLEKLSAGKSYVTDKMPANFLYIPFIINAFPNARIIHVHRDPRATCWSIFKHHFAEQGMGYAYNLADLVLYYNAYIDVMDTWYANYPRQIIHLNYDSLTSSPEVEIKRLISALNLSWEERTLYPEKNTRYVKTASAMQVRKIIYKGSSLSWKNFEPFVNFAFESLDEFASKPLLEKINLNDA